MKLIKGKLYEIKWFEFPVVYDYSDFVGPYDPLKDNVFFYFNHEKTVVVISESELCFVKPSLKNVYPFKRKEVSNG